MGKAFGQLAYIRNIIYIRLSPFEQRPWANFMSSSMRGIKRDFMANAPYIFPPFMATYLLIQWARAENDKFSRKNPADYENDV